MSKLATFKGEVKYDQERAKEFLTYLDKQTENSPLLFASTYTDFEDIIELLIVDGHNLDEQNVIGQSPIILCSVNNMLYSVKALVFSGASVDLTDDDGKTALIHACVHRSSDVVQFLITSGADFNIVDKLGKSCLIYAVISGSEEIVEMLLAQKALLNASDEDGKTALGYSTEHGVNNIFEQLMSAGASLDIQDNNGRTALMRSVAKQHKGMTDTLIASGANVNLRDKDGVAALSLGVATGNDDIVESLIAAGADVDQVDDNGNTALFSIKDILENNENTLVKGALREILDEVVHTLTTVDENDGNTLVKGRALKDQNDSQLVQSKYEEEAIELFNIKGEKKINHDLEIQKIKKLDNEKISNEQLKKVLHLLNKASADIEIKNVKGVKAKNISQKCTNDEILKLLNSYVNKSRPCEQGVTMEESSGEDDIMSYLNQLNDSDGSIKIPSKLTNKRNAKGQNILMLASLLGNRDVVKAAIESGININLKDVKGHSAVCYAARAGHSNIIELLNEHGAVLDSKDVKVHGPVTLAILAGKVEAVQTLAKLGADLNKKTRGMTILMVMASKGNFQMVQVLVHCKADVYAKDFKGKSASAYANANGHAEIYKFLKKFEL